MAVFAGQKVYYSCYRKAFFKQPFFRLKISLGLPGTNY